MKNNPEVKKYRKLPSAPRQAWDTDDIREYEQELEEKLAVYNALQYQEKLKTRLKYRMEAAASKKKMMSVSLAAKEQNKDLGWDNSLQEKNDSGDQGD